MPANSVITALFILLIALLIYALILVLPASMTMNMVLIIAVGVLGVMVVLVNRRVQKIVSWINGTPSGLPGQGTAGVAGWIRFATFARGATVGGGDPDPTKPQDPPPDM